MNIILEGQVVSQKNDKFAVINKRTGKPFIMSNKNVQAWKTNVAWQLKPIESVEGQVRIDMIFYNKDNRRRDLDNMATSVLDALKNAGTIEDDNCFVVRELCAKFGGVDRNRPRVEIVLTRLC